MFQGVGARYDAFGGTPAAAALAGALGGLALGHFIDRGHARRATWINAATLGGTLMAKARPTAHRLFVSQTFGVVVALACRFSSMTRGAP
jgi:MFS transporter, DHA1 family, inner membrane transport protein